MTNGFKECGKAARCADPEIDDNLQANLREQGNMSTRRQTWPRAHERSAFDTPSFRTQLGDWNEMHLACNKGKNLLYLKCTAWDAASVRGVELCVSRV
jgi:hypothetical protein